MLKKTMFLFISSLLLVAVLAACNNESKVETVEPIETETGEETETSGSASGSVESSNKNPVTLHALIGAGLARPMDALIELYEQETGVVINVSYNNNAGLMAQINLAKEGDLLIPGSQRVLDVASAEGHIEEERYGPFAFHTPVILVQKDNPKNIQGIEDLAQSGLTIAIPSREGTPLGQSAYEMFEILGITELVESNTIIEAQTGPEAVMALVSGGADIAISELAAFQMNRERLDAVQIDPDLNVLHAFMGATISYSEQKEEATQFLQFLEENAPEMFRYYGFNTKGEIH